jgi:hypothetical protein
MPHWIEMTATPGTRQAEENEPSPKVVLELHESDTVVSVEKNHINLCLI